jgi:DNA-binding transcriptional ArsR family regulator
MVKYLETRLDATFGALADTTRRAILARLALGETSVTEIATRFDISLPGVMKHLRVLESAGLLASEKDGRVRRCRLSPAPLRTAAEWIDFYQRFWEEQFDALEEFLKQSPSEAEEDSWPAHRDKRLKPSSGSAARSRRRGKKSSRPGPTRQ